MRNIASKVYRFIMSALALYALMIGAVDAMFYVLLVAILVELPEKER